MPLMKGGEGPARSDERIDFLFAVAREPMLILEPGETLSDSRITDCNQEALNLFGYRRASFVGLPLSRVEVPGAGGEAVPAEATSGEARYRRSDGQVLIVERTFQRVESDGRELLLVSMHDVTAARLLERAVVRVQQMDNLGMVSGTLVHDFRNLLVSVLANAELALAAPDDAEAVRERVEDIARSARRATELVDRVLPSSTGDQPLVPLDLDSVVDDAVELMRGSLPANITLERSVHEEPLPIAGDATQLRQVVMNLVINACEAIGDAPGTVRVGTGMVAASEVDLAGAYPPLSERAEQWVYLDVADSGAGVDSATRERIFEPLFTTKSDGTGLGLTAVQFAVRRHGGTVTLHSEPGEGSSFRILFPVDES